MSNERRLEYDKGPSLEEGSPKSEHVEATDADREGESDEFVRKNPASHPGRVVVAVAPWKAGLAAGVSAFAAVFAVTYQLAASMFGMGMFGQVENEPAQWVVAGFTMLGSHGAVIVEGEEAIRGAYAPMGMFASHVSALVPIVVLGVVGYLLVRYLSLETLADAGQLVGTLTASYVALTVVLGTITQWSPQEPDPAPGEVGAEAEVLSVAVDASVILSTTVSVLVFVALGGALAALPRLLERAPLETTATGPAASDSVAADSAESEPAS